MSMLKLGPGARELTGFDPSDALFIIEYLKDCDHRRAAVAAGREADEGYKLFKRPDIHEKLCEILCMRLDASHIDAEWALGEAVDNHRIARQMGNITASNTALNMVMKHKNVNAFAAEKIEVKEVSTVQEALLKSRQRVKRLKKEQEALRTAEHNNRKAQKLEAKLQADKPPATSPPVPEVSFL